MIGFSNALTDISEFSLQKLRTKGLVSVFLELMCPEGNNLQLMETALETIYTMITECDDENTQFLREIDQNGGRKILEQLSQCNNERISQKASFLIDNYFQNLDTEMNN